MDLEKVFFMLYYDSLLLYGCNMSKQRAMLRRRHITY